MTDTCFGANSIQRLIGVKGAIEEEFLSTPLFNTMIIMDFDVIGGLDFSVEGMVVG